MNTKSTRPERVLRSRKVSAVAAVILFAFLVSSHATAQDKRVDLTAGNIEISLLLPADLLPFSEQKMALVREKGIAAKFIFSDQHGDLIAAINTFGSGADEQRLSRVGEQIKVAAEKQGGAPVEWLRNEQITMNGKKWLRLAFTEGSGSDALINEYFVTDWIGEYVLVNFSSPIAKYDSYKSAVERSAQSLRLGLIANVELTRDTVKPKRQKP